MYHMAEAGFNRCLGSARSRMRVEVSALNRFGARCLSASCVLSDTVGQMRSGAFLALGLGLGTRCTVGAGDHARVPGAVGCVPILVDGTSVDMAATPARFVGVLQ